MYNTLRGQNNTGDPKMDPRKHQPTVTATAFGVSTTSGTGIKGAVLNIYRHHDAPDRRAIGLVPYFRSQHGDLDGVVYPSVEAANQAALEHGYTRYYSRNLCKFVQSRAARRRGYVCRDWSYLSRARGYAARIARDDMPHYYGISSKTA